MDPTPTGLTQLKDLRKRSRLSQAELARRVSVDTSLVSRWEAGERAPSAQNVVDLAVALGISVDYLLNAQVRPSFSFRAQVTGSDGAAEQQALRDAEAQIHFLDAIHRMATTVAPPFTLRTDFNEQFLAQITNQMRVALRLNMRIRFGELLQALTEQGVFVFVWQLPLSISGMSYRGAYSVVFVNGRHTPQRQLFTLAHELGHLLFHLKDGEQTTISQVASNRDPQEGEANKFASELLMPGVDVDQLIQLRGVAGLRKPTQLAMAAELFNVSRDAMFYRLVGKGVFDWKERWTYFTQGKLDADTALPAHRVDGIDTQVPLRMRELALQLYDAGEISAGKLAEWFAASRLNVDDMLFAREASPVAYL